jgi:hypothetical protein
MGKFNMGQPDAAPADQVILVTPHLPDENHDTVAMDEEYE